MKILGIVGSKRRQGNTAILVKEALHSASMLGAKTSLLFLDDYHIEGCRGCEGCRNTYQCIIPDDMQSIYPQLLSADGLIFGSPTYFYNVSADAKAFIDRCYCLEAFDPHDRSCWLGITEAAGGKYAVTIAVCEQESEKDMGITSYALTEPLTALGYRVVDSVKILNLFEAGAADSSATALKQAARAGERLARTIKLREAVAIKLKDLQLGSFSG